MLKATKDTTFSGAVATVEAYFEGPAVPVTYSLVNGSKSFNNSDFTINSTTGEISLTSTQALGNYYARYRVTRDDRPEEFVEGNLRLSIAPETAPTVNDITLSSGLVADEVVGVAVTTFNNSPEFELQMNTSLGANPAPESAAGDFKIGPVGEVTPGEAQIKWTGRGSQSNEYDYAYTALCRDGQCFSGSTEFDIYHNVPLSATMGTDIGSLGISGTWTAPQESYLWEDTDPATVLSLARGHSQPSNLPGGSPNFGLSVSGASFTLRRSMFHLPDLTKYGATEFLLGMALAQSRGADQDTTIVYTTSAPTGPNFTADMHNWTLIDSLLTSTGRVSINGLPMTQEFWIGAMSTYDYNNALPSYAIANTQNRMNMGYSGGQACMFNNARPEFRGAGTYHVYSFGGGTCAFPGRHCADVAEYDSLVADTLAATTVGDCDAAVYWLINFSTESGAELPNIMQPWRAANPSKRYTWQ